MLVREGQTHRRVRCAESHAVGHDVPALSVRIHCRWKGLSGSHTVGPKAGLYSLANICSSYLTRQTATDQWRFNQQYQKEQNISTQFKNQYVEITTETNVETSNTRYDSNHNVSPPSFLCKQLMLYFAYDITVNSIRRTRLSNSNISATYVTIH